MADRTPLHDLAAQAGAAFTEADGWEIPTHFRDPAREYESARAHAALFDVSSRGKIEVAGRDAVTFLHNLATNDIKNLPPGAGCEAFLATAKARVVAQLWVYRQVPAEPASLWLDVAGGTAAAVMSHLNHHLISERVELTDHTRDLAQLHLCGPEAPALVGRVLGPTAGALAQLHHCRGVQEGVISTRRRDLLGVPGFDVVATGEAARQLWQALTAAGAMPAGLETWEILRVEAGLPADGVDMDETRFVVEVGRGARAISYTKGCYLGQEPIVMARDRGHVNRLLMGVRLSGEPMAPGTKLLREGQEVGQVTSSVFSPRLGTALGLAYVRRGSQEPGTVLEIEAGAGRGVAFVSALPFVAGGSAK
jgi:folate-binding protein YgfZ